MTVGDNLHQTLTSLEGAKSSLEEFALATNDKQAEKMYNQCAQQLKNVSKQLENRVNYVEGEEPQFKARQTGQQNQTQQ